MKIIYKKLLILIAITSSLFFSISSYSYADEIKMKCETENVLSDNFTLFKYEKSLFGKKKVLHRTNGSWVDLFENPNVREYKVGDKSASFLVRKRSDWWFRIVLDFEMRENQVKVCYNSDCSGSIINSGSVPCS